MDAVIGGQLIIITFLMIVISLKLITRTILVVTCMSHHSAQVQMNSLGSIHTDTPEEYRSHGIQNASGVQTFPVLV